MLRDETPKRTIVMPPPIPPLNETGVDMTKVVPPPVPPLPEDLNIPVDFDDPDDEGSLEVTPLPQLPPDPHTDATLSFRIDGEGGFRITDVNTPRIHLPYDDSDGDSGEDDARTELELPRFNVRGDEVALVLGRPSIRAICIDCSASDGEEEIFQKMKIAIAK
jgi:hypothetical protein